MNTINLTYLRFRLSMLGLFCFTIGFAQKMPNLEGEYIFKEFGGGSSLYIFDKNNFFIVLGRSAVKGKVEIKEDALVFIVDHPNPEFILYGRNALHNRIILKDNTFRYGLSFGNIDEQNTTVTLRDIEKNKSDYCQSNYYFLPIEKKTNNFVFQSKETRKAPLTFFKLDSRYKEFLVAYLTADDDVSFLNDFFSIAKNNLVFDTDNIQRKIVNKKEIQDLLDEVTQIDKVNEQEVIFLDQDYGFVSNKRIDMSQYSYDELKMHYIKKDPKKISNAPEILYKFSKIKSYNNEINVHENNSNILYTKCVETPESIRKKREDESRSYEREPLKVIEPMKPLID